MLWGSWDDLHTGVQDLEAVKFPKFVDMSGIEERRMSIESTLKVCSVG